MCLASTRYWVVSLPSGPRVTYCTSAISTYISRFHNVAGYLVPGSRVDSPLSPIPPRHSAVIKLIYESLVEPGPSLFFGASINSPARTKNHISDTYGTTHN